MLNLSRLGAVRALFFKSEQYQLIDMPIHIGASVDKHGHIKAAHTRIQKVRVERAAPVQSNLFGGDEPAQKDNRPARLDAFVRKHGGLAQLAHLMIGMSEGQQQRIFEEMGKLGGKTVVEISALFDHVRPESAPQADMFAQPAATPDTVTESRQELIDEHKHLVDVLNSPSHEDDKVEAKKQSAELEGYEAGEPTVKESLTVAAPDSPTLHRYALQYRPPGIGAVPNGFVSHSEDQSIPAARHGVIAYDRELTADEVKQFELIPLGSDGAELQLPKLPYAIRKRVEEAMSSLHYMADAVKAGDANLSDYKGDIEEAQAALHIFANYAGQKGIDKDKVLAELGGIPDFDASTPPAAAVAPGLVEYTTRKGKTLRGIVRTDLSKEDAKNIDPYTFRHEGGWFVREKHLASQENGVRPAGIVPELEASADTTGAGHDPATVAVGDQGSSNATTVATDPLEVDDRQALPFGVAAGTSKADRRRLNAAAADLVATKAEFDEHDRAILRQYSGNGGCGDSLNEFYTLPEVASAMWSVAQRLGVKGEVLEPSCGPGVFLHTAPGDATVTGVEMDETSASIAKALHGDRHEIKNASLERFATQDARQFAAVLGNVPFGLRGTLIKDDKPKLKTADAYFCDTAMDKCKAAGVVGLIVPTGIMDSRTNRKLREAMLRKGQFLGAQRMPNTAFEHSHTEVTTDVIWFRKYPDDVAGALSSDAVKRDHLKTLGVWDDEFIAGNYFTGRGAENVLGKMGEGWRAKAGMGADITVEGSMAGVPEALREFQPEEHKAAPAVTDILAAVGDDEKARATVLGGALVRPYADKARVGDTKNVDGVAYVLQGNPPRWRRIDEVLQSEALTQGQDIAERIEAMMAGMTAVDRPRLEADLRAWVEAHGTPSKNKDILLGAAQDKTLFRLIGAVKSNGELSDAVLGKSAVHVKGDFEATVQGMLTNHETVAVNALARAAGIHDEEALDQLYGSPKYALDAETGEWTTRDIYLSGDLWAKSDAVTAALAGELADKDMRKKLEKQSALLMEAIAPVSLEDAFIQTNSAFLPPSVLAAFLTWKNKEAPDANKWTKELAPVEITFADGVYVITGGNSYGMMKNLDQYLNRTGLRKDDKHVIDDLNVEFKDWLCASAEYRELAEDLYNRKFRGFAEREFSNEPMSIPGMNTEGLKDYQWGGLRWALNAGKGIIAADVGLGKTARALMLARTLKTTGQARRPMIVVPKSVLSNWAAECEKWFPGSKVLLIGEKGDSPAERKRKYHDMQQNDYDFIICSEPSFEEIDLDPTTKGEYNSKDFWVQRGDAMDRASDKRTAKIKAAWDQARAGQEFGDETRTDATYFNELGVDALICDEFHHCFPAGTLVDGVPIEALKAGDFVKSFNHDTAEVEYKQVLAVAAMPAKPLARVTLSTGQQIVSTFDHRFFTTEFGYVEAQHLNGFCSVILNTTKTTKEDGDGRNLQGVRGDFHHDAKPETTGEERGWGGVRESVPLCEARAGCDESVLSVRRRVHAEQGSAVEIEERDSGSVLLHHELFCAMASGAAGVAGLAENAGNQEEAKRGAEGVQLASVAGIEGPENGSSSNALPDKSERAASTRGEREGRICSAADACRCVVLGDGVLCENREAKEFGLSAPLHDRHCESIYENCNRSGREQSQQPGTQGSGSQENANLGIARVVSVAILKPGSDGEFERLCSNGLVYDIEVDGNHNFFAEGVLVHNCKNLCAIKSRFGESPKFLGGGGQSMRSLDFNLKARWLLDQQNGKNVYGLTATPTKNSPIEIYAMLSHVAPEAFERIGVRNSEEFLDRFAKFEDGMALTTGGLMEDALITKGFQNMDELRDIMRRYIHRQTADDVGLKLPERQDVTHMIDMDAAQESAYSELRALAAESGGKDSTGDAHIFSIMDKMNKAAVDLSLVDDAYDGTKSPKYVACAQGVIKGMKDGGQIVFSDYVQSHEKIVAALVKSGIPRDQIGVINAQAAKTSEARQKICDQFNSGKLKVVIGNTATMGEGLNLQKGTSDIHHLDLPWEPASMQQRNGRGLRQGNTNKGVRIHSYLAKGSFDGYRLQSILAKKDWQDMIWNGGSEVENLNQQGSISRDEMMIMLSSDPDQAREAFESNHKAKEERLIAGKTADAAQRFVKFQEVKRSYGSIQNKNSQSAAKLKAKLDKEYSGLKHDKYFTAKQALDMETPVIVTAGGALLHAGAGLDIGEGDKSERYVVTSVDQRGQKVTMRRYGDGSTQLYTRDVKDISDLKTFAYDEKTETDTVAKELAARPMVIKQLSDVMKLPTVAVEANHEALQKQIWEGSANYSISLGHGKVAMVEKATGKPVITDYYNIGVGKKDFNPENYDFMLPTEANKAKAVQAWKDARRASSFSVDYVDQGKRRQTKTVAKRNYGSSLEHNNPWSLAMREMHGEDAVRGSLQSPTLKAARASLETEQLDRVRHAPTLQQAFDEAAAVGTIGGADNGYGAHVSLPKKVIATLWAKARKDGVLDLPVNRHLPKQEIYGRASNKHAAYFTGSQNDEKSVHSVLLGMAARAGHDDLVHAMVESESRHGKGSTTNAKEALQAISQGYGHSENRILAMQKLADKAGILDMTRGQIGAEYGTIGANNQWDPDRAQTVRDKLAELLATSRAKAQKEVA